MDSPLDTASAWARAAAERDDLVAWLTGAALPLWWEVGADHANGGFFEKIGRDGRPIEEPRRTRVVARQIYSYATADEIGWSGPVDAAVDHGLAYFRRCCLAPDGLVARASRPDGARLDETFDLYDHAFALFGLAAAYARRPDPEIAATAERMRERMRAGWSHPQAGFERSRPRSLPLEANPHMHVFEACLAWVEAAPSASRADWLRLADEIGALCLARFVDPVTGALREFYDGDWRPIAGDAGRLVEPGHQFEWAWLLIRWGRLRGEPAAIAAARRLVEIAETHGVDPRRGVAFAELWDDFAPRDRHARVWPQTERIKAWLAMATLAVTAADRDAALDRVTLAARGLKKFLADDVVGAWNERMREDGGFLDEPAPASSLYHITCAVAEMVRVLPRLVGR